MSDQALPQGPTWRIDTWFPDLDVSIREKMRIYHDELQKFNRSLNLVSAKTLPFADAIHFADCMIASSLIVNAETGLKTIYDLGSGSGLPGLVFAIMFPSVSVKLVEMDQKKCEFLKHVASTCELKNVEVLHTQIEKLEVNSIKTCVTRGFASISKSILLTRKCVAVGGSFYHLKGEAWSAEVGEIPTQLCSVWSPALVGEYKLPIGSFKFAVVKTNKIA